MLKKIVLSFILVCALLVSPVYAAKAVHIYFNWTGNATTDTKLILLGLPDSPIETTFVKVPNPQNPSDETYYQAVYDCMSLPDGSYTLTGKMKNKWGESEASEPYPFVKEVPVSVSNMELGVSSD